MKARTFGAIVAMGVLAPEAVAQTPAPSPDVKSVPEVRVTGLRSDPADSLERVGLFAYSDGLYATAEDAFIEAILSNTKANGTSKHGASLAQLYSNLAWLYYETGRFGEADSLLRRALVLEEKASGEVSQAAARRTGELAMLNQAAGRYEEAGRLIDTVIVLQAKLPQGDPREAAFALHLLARNYHATGNSRQSETFYKKVLESLDERETLDASLWATTMLHLAELYHAEHRDLEAREAFTKALARANQVYAADGLPNALVLNPYSVLLRRATAVRATSDSARH